MSDKTEIFDYCSSWYKTLAGKTALDQLDEHCADLMSEMFGYYAIETGFLSGKHDLLASSRIAAGFSLVNKGNENLTQNVAKNTAKNTAKNVIENNDISVISSVEQLPVATDNIDLVVASHVLESSEDPHQVLREIDRVLVPEGHCILIGFNPFAISRLAPQVSKLARRGYKSKQSVKEMYKLRSAHRVRDWFSLLGFEVVDVHYMGFRPNVKNPKLFNSFNWLDKAGEYIGPALGKLYVFHVKKQVIAMRPYKKVWKAPAVLSGGKVVINRTAQRIRRENYSNL